VPELILVDRLACTLDLDVFANQLPRAAIEIISNGFLLRLKAPGRSGPGDPCSPGNRQRNVGKRARSWSSPMPLTILYERLSLSISGIMFLFDWLIVGNGGFSGAERLGAA